MPFAGGRIAHVIDHTELGRLAVDELGLGAGTDELFPVIYEELRALAAAWFARRKPTPTLQPTAIVHEAYLRLASSNATGWKDCEHFRAVAAKVMRQVLVDHARRRQAQRRGGQWIRVTLTGDIPASPDDARVDLVKLDEVIEELSGLNERHAGVAELRVFGGLSAEQIARLIGVSKRTVELDWQMARSWLYAKLDSED